MDSWPQNSYKSYHLPWNIAALGGSTVLNSPLLPQAEGIHLTFDLLWSTLGWGTDAKGWGGLSSGEISLFSSVYPLDRCAMIKNGGKICQMVVPCLIIKGAPVPETVGSILKALHIDSAIFSISLVTLIYTYNAMGMWWSNKWTNLIRERINSVNLENCVGQFTEMWWTIGFQIRNICKSSFSIPLFNKFNMHKFAWL